MRTQKTILAIMVVLCVSTAAQAKYSGGTGEPNDPYLIATAEDMNAIGADSNDWDAHFLLVADINIADYTGTQFNIIGNLGNPFTGVFDGNDHKILNFTYSCSTGGCIGLFGYVGTGGQIKNLGLENVIVNTQRVLDVGGLVGENEGTIINCYTTGNISGTLLDGNNNWVGGLVGYNWNSGTITNCYFIGTVSGTIVNGYLNVVGGLVGGSGGTITNCYSTGNVRGTSPLGNYIGGLAGENGGTITNCYSTGSASGNDDVGGLVGRNNQQGTITNCYSTGSVTGNACVGGLVGYNIGPVLHCYAAGCVDGNDYTGGLVGYNRSTISNCYATGTVSGHSGYKYAGGLVGRNGHNTSYPGYIYNCYSTGEVTGSSNVGGLVGLYISGEIGASFWDVNTSGQSTSAGGTPKTTAEMKTESTFTDAGWDFVCEMVNGTDEVWTIKEGVDYPKLVWECFEDYQEWLAAGKPPCWLCPRQCHGDADNTPEYIKGKGYYHVHFKDLNVLLTAWNIKEPNDGPGIAWPDPNICADFDHNSEYIKNKGYYRVHFKDMAILLANWNVKEPPDGPGIEPNCLDCP